MLTIRSSGLAGALLALVATACGGGGGGIQPPSQLSYDGAGPLALVDLPVAAAHPSVHGTVERYSVEPALPPGLALDPATGVLSGTPIEVAARRPYTIRAHNRGGSVGFAFDLAVLSAPRFAYVAARDDSTLSILRVDAADGRLERSGLCFAPSGQRGPEHIVVHPSQRFLFVPNAETDNLSCYAVGDDGWLTARAPVPLDAGPHRAAVRPDGRFVYVTSRGAGTLHTFAVEPLSGVLTPAGAPLTGLAQPGELALDPEGRFVFLTEHGVGSEGARVRTLRSDSSSGLLTAVEARIELPQGSPSGLRVGLVRPLVFVTFSASNQVLPLRYERETGVLTALPTQSTGAGPEALAVDPLGRFTFVANRASGTLSCFRIDQETGGLSEVSTAASGVQPAALVLDPLGRFLYVANASSHDLMQFDVAAASGELAAVETWTLRPGPCDVAFVHAPRIVRPAARFLHVLNAGSNDVSNYTLEAAGLPQEQHPTSSAGHAPRALLRHPRHAVQYAFDAATSTLGEYRVDAGDGRLTPIGAPEPLGGSEVALAVDPAGRFVYAARREVVTPGDAWLATFAVDPFDASLTLRSDQPIAAKPVALSVEPNGRFLFVARRGQPNEIQTFALERDTGLPLAVGTPVPAPGISALTCHPTGRSLYGVLHFSNALLQYTLEPESGQLGLVLNVSRAGIEPVGLVFSADGSCAWAAFQDSAGVKGQGHVARFEVDRATGRLITPALTYAYGTNPSALVLEPGGRRLFVTNSGSHDLTTFDVDPATGELTARGSVATGLEPRAIGATPIQP